MLCRKRLVLGALDGVVLTYEHYIEVTTAGASGGVPDRPAIVAPVIPSV